MILVFASTRAELIKMSPLIKELKKQNIEHKVVATGQHNLWELQKKFDIEIIYLTQPPEGSSKFGLSKLKALKFSIDVIFKTKKLYRYLHPKYVIVHGDTLSCALVSIASKICGRKLMHIESGLNSFNTHEPFPEEIMRRIAIKLSDYHFAPTKESVENLKGKKNVYYVGNTIYDVLKSYDIDGKFDGNYVVASIHRQENMNNKTRMRIIVNAMNYCNKEVFLFAHDPFLIALKKYHLKLNENVIIKKLATHEEFIAYLSNCSFVIGDGGSIQEECAYYNKPYVMMRAWTERKVLEPKPGASKRIAKIIKKII